jgi:type IV fimbrial biogenesis protein FimT
LSKHFHAQSGATLVELMVVVLIIAMMAIATMPVLQEQIAIRQIDSVARRLIAHAHFARDQAMHLGEPVLLTPANAIAWDAGWVVQSGCIEKGAKPSCVPKHWFSQASIAPIYLKSKGGQFADPHSGKRGILFNAAGAAKSGHGGFVANRLILGHRLYADLERHLILGSGGRWRICDPKRDAKRCL